MLVCLHIENIAVIEKADVEFDKGFTVLTGETGAGKSILIDSINAVLGERTSKELIRAGCDRAVVSASFCNVSEQVKSKLSELGFSADDELLITRTLTDSKSTAKINGQPATASMIREISPLLVNIHGQHDSQALLLQEKHYTYIDALAKNETILIQYDDAFRAMQATRKKLKALTESLEGKEKRIELLKFQINELEAADIKIGERDELTKRRDLMNNMQNITEALQTAHLAIAGDEDSEIQGAVSLADAASEQLASISRLSDKSSQLYDVLESAKSQLEEVKSGIDSLISESGFDGDELARIEERLDMYYHLSFKYGDTEEKMLSYLEKSKTELKTIETSDEEIVSQSALLQKQVEDVKAYGAKLTESRKQAGQEFAKSVAEQLEFLNMPNVKIIVDITGCAYSHLGADRVEFLISTNPGEPPKPLSKIASGGEMSRIMLAIKNVLASNDPVDTLIFDEIDTGISGKAAQKVGYKLKQTASGKQVICVTHLAQIAALADTHLLIEKNIDSGRAVTTITPLDFDGRRHELARIIGSDVTDATLRSAEEMLRY